MNAQDQYYMEYPNCQSRHSFKNKFFKHFSKKNEPFHCNDNFGVTQFFDRLGMKIESKFDKLGKSIESKSGQLGKSIELKVEECRAKAAEKLNKKKQDLKGFIMKKMMDTFVDNSKYNPVPEVEREETKMDVEAASQVVSSPEGQHLVRSALDSVTCQYCNDNILVSFIQEHVSSCIYRSENNMMRCGDCGGCYKLVEAQNHFKDCQGNIENINIQCEQCNNMVAMKSYFYHLSICASQPFEQRGEEFLEIPAREISECAICLLEIKRDGSGRFLECAHHFHGDCIDDWGKKQKSCPICLHQL